MSMQFIPCLVSFFRFRLTFSGSHTGKFSICRHKHEAKLTDSQSQQCCRERLLVWGAERYVLMGSCRPLFCRNSQERSLTPTYQ